jgi:hypothetical protein
MRLAMWWCYALFPPPSSPHPLQGPGLWRAHGPVQPDSLGRVFPALVQRRRDPGLQHVHCRPGAVKPAILNEVSRLPPSPCPSPLILAPLVSVLPSLCFSSLWRVLTVTPPEWICAGHAPSHSPIPLVYSRRVFASAAWRVLCTMPRSKPGTAGPQQHTPPPLPNTTESAVVVVRGWGNAVVP